MNRSVVCCVPVLLLVAAAISAARADEAPAPAPTRVELQFGWKPGLERVVTGTRTRIRSAEETVSRSSTSRYRQRVGTEGENLRIQFIDPEFDAAVGATADSPAEQAKMMEKIAELMPDFIVTHQGEFVGIHDLPGFQKKLQGFLVGIMPPNPAGTEEASAVVLARMQSMLTSEAFLNSRAAEEWNAIIGAWSGASFEVGVPEEFSRGEPVAAFAGNEIRMNYAFVAEKVLTCKRGGVERRCAVLLMRSESDPEDTKRLVESFLQSLAPDLSPQTPMFRTLAIENVLRVTTEPEGLIPHAYTLTKTMTGTVVTPNGDLPIEQIDTTEVTYADP